MSFEEQPDFASQVADLNKYGQALNRCRSVEEVVSLTLEAMSLLFEFSSATFVEVRDGDLRVVHSTNPAFQPDDQPSDIARRAYDSGETVTLTGEEARTVEGSDTTAALAVPASIVDEVTAVLVTRSSSATEFDESHVRPLEILASHAATAISNIRSHERLERARRDLERRKEMIEMYDRLLRHDLGNDLQVIAGFADAVASDVEGETAEYAERIQRASHNAADLVSRVGELVTTLEEQDESEPQDLREILTDVVSRTAFQYETLSVEYDSASADYRIYGGELLDSVFTNVLTNAAVHNDGEVTATVRVEPIDRDELVVAIADDGSGVDPEVRDELFEMGVKGPDSGGSGFGLGLVSALVQSYGGDAHMTESERGGAEFRLHLRRV